MNIAYLDPPYSGYFHTLAAKLAGDGGSVVALLSSPAYKLYTNGDRCELWRTGDADAEYALPAEFATAAWARTDAPVFRRAFSHAVAWFKERFAAERIDVCLVFSDARPFSQAARVAAQDLGVICVYFERGALRNRTASLSTLGLNARFDLVRAGRDEGVHGVAPAAVPPRRRTERWLKLRFAAFMALNAWACSRDPDLRPMQHKTYHPFNYARIAWRQWAAAREERRGRRARIAGTAGVADDGRPVVLLPLQLQTDSQFVMHSPFPHNQAFIDFVVPRIRAVLPQARVLVKKHPMDVRRFRLPAGTELVDGNLAPLYGRAALVVCLNSTAGFEAAVRGKPVLCFADSFYTRNEAIVRVDREGFEAALRERVARGDDPAAGQALHAAVLRWYQAPGDTWAYTDDDLEATADIVRQHLRAAREPAAAPVEPSPVSASASDPARA